MSEFNYLKYFNEIHFLILIGKTGSSARFAKKIGSSHKQLLDNLEKLKKMGAPIIFSETMKSYCYETNWLPFENKFTKKQHF